MSDIAKPRCKATYRIADWAQREDGPARRQCRKRGGPTGFCKQCETLNATVMKAGRT